jgi:hypothetical protein
LYVIRTDKNGNAGSCNTVSISPTTQPFALSSSNQEWIITDGELIPEVFSVPASAINNSTATLCKSSSCDPVCTKTCTIISIPLLPVYTGGNPNTIYLGYGAQGTILKAISSALPLSFTWTGNGPLNCTNCPAPVFIPQQPGSYTFTCTIKYANGCKSICSITICVIDIRVPGTHGLKVYLCHVPPGHPNNAQTLSLNIAAVPAHLLIHPGDHLGKCGQEFCPGNSHTDNEKYVVKAAEQPGDPLNVSVYPNPGSSSFIFDIKARSSSTVTIMIRDINGMLVMARKGFSVNEPIKIGSDLMKGIYTAEIIQGNERKILKLIKL